MLDMQKKMEQETRYHHMFGYIQTATPRGDRKDGRWGGGVEGEDETSEVGGPGRDEIS
jgi:hypothetical protein